MCVGYGRRSFKSPPAGCFSFCLSAGYSSPLSCAADQNQPDNTQVAHQAARTELFLRRGHVQRLPCAVHASEEERTTRRLALHQYQNRRHPFPDDLRHEGDPQR